MTLFQITDQNSESKANFRVKLCRLFEESEFYLGKKYQLNLYNATFELPPSLSHFYYR
jgi:hypothetical protein